MIKDIQIPPQVEERLGYIRIVSGIFLSNAIIYTIIILTKDQVTQLIAFYAIGLIFLLCYFIAYNAYVSVIRYLTYHKKKVKTMGYPKYIEQMKKNHPCCSRISCANIFCVYWFCEKAYNEYEDDLHNAYDNNDDVESAFYEKKNSDTNDRINK